MPYYLLIVGDPETIPYSFQYQLDIQYAVGRLHFNSLDEYASYARSVVAAESTGPTRARRVGVFAPKHAGDRPIELSMRELVEPLVERLTVRNPSWDVEAVLGETATKLRLRRLLGGRETPALLFIASHGMGFSSGHDSQLRDQGAILCQDWPGPLKWQGAVPEEHYFSGSDVGLDARLRGLITFLFAEYSAGTPKWENFAFSGSARQLAPNAFTAYLPQRLLGHPRGERWQSSATSSEPGPTRSWTALSRTGTRTQPPGQGLVQDRRSVTSNRSLTCSPG